MASNEIRGRRAERGVAKKYDLAVVPDSEARWYDAKNPRTGAKYEVKSAAPNGMFRFWKDQHRRLSAANSQGTSYYVLVKMHGDQPGAYMRVKPATVTKTIEKRGGWNEPVHRRRQKQKKVPVRVFFG